MTTSKRGKARNHMCSMCGASMHILWVTDCALGGTTRHRRCDNATCWHVEAVAKMDAKVYTTLAPEDAASLGKVLVLAELAVCADMSDDGPARRDYLARLQKSIHSLGARLLAKIHR